MGFRTNIILLLIVAAIGFGLWHFKKDPTKRPPEQGSIDVQVITESEFRTAKEFRVLPQPKGKSPELVFVRRPDGDVWLAEPLQDVARRAFVEDLFRQFTQLRLREHYGSEALAADPSLWEKTGLAEPMRMITFVLSDDTERSLAVGGVAPTTGGVFVKFGNKIYTTSNRAPASALNVNVGFVREKQLFRMPRIERIVVERKRGEELEVLELAYERGHYRIKQPRELRADTPAVKAFVQALGAMRIERFLTGDKPKYLEAPDFKVTMYGAQGRDVVSLHPAPGSGPDAHEFIGYDERRRIAFVLKHSRGFGALQRKVNDLRARFVVPVQVEKIVQIDLDPGPAARAKGDKKVELKRGMGSFQMSKPVISATRGSSMNPLLEGIRNLVVEKFIDDIDDLDSLGFDENAPTITIHSRQPRQRITLRVGKVVGTQAYLKRVDEDFAVLVPAEQASKLCPNWLELLHRLNVIAHQIPPFRMEVATPDGKRFQYHFHNEEWRDTKKSDADPLVGELVTAFGTGDGKGLDAKKAFALDSSFGKPTRLTFHRTAAAGSDTLLTVLVYGRDGKVFVAGGAVPAGVVFQPRLSVLATLMQRWRQ